MLHVRLHQSLRIYFFICTWLFVFFVSLHLLHAMEHSNVEVFLDVKHASLEFENAIKRVIIAPADEKITVRPFAYYNFAELHEASTLIAKNINERPGYKQLPKEVLQLYREANTTDNLYQTMLKKGMFSYVAYEAHKKMLGIVVVCLNQWDEPQHVQLKRLHRLPQGVKGIGKALLNTCVAVACRNGISRLTADAAMPARSFFEHLGWHGLIVETPYKLSGSNDIVQLPQFKCSFEMKDDFEGF